MGTKHRGKRMFYYKYFTLNKMKEVHIMSKKILKRSLALGALMAFVITGSAWAADRTVNPDNPVIDETFDKIIWNTTSTGGALYNSKVLEIKDSEFTNNKITKSDGKGGAIYNSGTLTVSGSTKFEGNEAKKYGGAIYNSGILTINGDKDNKILFANNISESGGAIYNTGKLTINYGEFKENKVKVNSGHGKGGAIVSSGGNMDLINCEFIGSKVEGGGSPYGTAIHITGSKNTIEECSFSGHSEAPIYVNTGSIELKDKNTFTGNKGAIQIVAGKISFTGKENEFNENRDRSAIYVAGGIVEFKDGSKTNMSDNTSRDIYTKGSGKVNINTGAEVISNSGIYSTNTFNGDEGGININGGTLGVGATSDIAHLGGTGGTIKYLKDINLAVYKNTVSGELNFSVEDGKVTDAVNGNIEELIGDAFAANEKGATFKLARGSVAGEVEGTLEGEEVTNDDGSKKFVYRMKASDEKPHEGNAAISHNANIAMMAWRAETNDMNKRLGELRNANGDLGVWVRMVGGEDEFKSVEYDYTQYQLGYDEKLSVDPSWTVGVALSYTDGESKFTDGSGENTHKGLSVYGSKLNDDGSFIDLIAKYSRLEHDLISNSDKGDYSTNGYSVSAEYGKRFQQGKGLWIEPQVELTYGKVKSAEYKLGDKTVSQDAMESLVGRVGFSLGKDIKQGNVYARASYLYDFEGETNMAFANSGARREFKYDLGGGWWEIGVGANINLSKATYIYADVEKTFGGEVDTNWQWNLGVRYSF